MNPSRVPGAELRALPFSALTGWDKADLSAFWRALHAGAEATAAKTPPLRAAQPDWEPLRRAVRAIAQLPVEPGDTRHRVERLFEPFAVEGPGFVTGYYEPLVEGAWTRSAAFAAPILPRPADLVTFGPGETHPAVPEGYTAARRQPDGTLAPTLDRAAIEDHAMRAPAEALIWLRDWVEVFLVQVQGSARVRLPDGSQRRLIYAGRNGHPYSSIGRHLVNSGRIVADAMSLDGLKAWLRAHGQEVGEEGRSVMQRNASYVFFRLEQVETGAGPIGGAGAPLTALGSIAVDRAVWPYGLPFWIETDSPVRGFGPAPLRRLFVGQDTGSAIVGPARADLFLGSGPDAGRDAGSIRHAARMTVLLPRPL